MRANVENLKKNVGGNDILIRTLAVNGVSVQGPLEGILIMVILVVEFSTAGYIFRKIFSKKSTYPKKIIEFCELV